MQPSGGTTHKPDVAELDAAWAAVTGGQRHLLDTIAALDPDDDRWSRDGCRGLPEWLGARLGISVWAARRWITASRALTNLPVIAATLDDGTLSLDKAVELCRFATPETEARLVAWARRVTVWGIRRRADVANRPSLDDVRAADRERYVTLWWYDDGTRLGLEGSLPADAGAVVARALDRVALRIPDVVTDDDERPSVTDKLDARRADALVALCSQTIADDADPDRATVVVHASVDALASDEVGCEIEDGPVLHPETMRRLGCDCRLEVLVHDSLGKPIGIGRAARNIPGWLVRALKRRDRGCTFPGCGARSFLKAHHIRWWGRGGTTDLDNLVLCCHLHHKLVHEGGWGVRLNRDATVTWLRPGGREFDPGRAPPPLADAWSHRQHVNGHNAGRHQARNHSAK